MSIPREVDSYGWTVAVHGEFCTGCEAKSGRCGELTSNVKAREREIVEGLKTELSGLLKVADSMTPTEAVNLRQILRTGANWYTLCDTPLTKTAAV